MPMIPGGMLINDDPSDDEIPTADPGQVTQPNLGAKNIGPIDPGIPKRTPRPSFSQAPTALAFIHGQAIQPDPGIQNNGVLELTADQKDQKMAADIISAAFSHDPPTEEKTKFLIEEHMKEKHQQEHTGDGIPTARSAMGRWVYPILYESIKGILTYYANQRENDKEQKIMEIKNNIKRRLPKKLASNYYHGIGPFSFFKGPISERSWETFFCSLPRNLNPLGQHAYTDPVLRMTPSLHNTPDQAKAEDEKKLDKLREQTRNQTKDSINALNEHAFPFREPSRP
jgi:hypothetical protein